MFRAVRCFIGRQDCSVWSVLRLSFFREPEFLIFSKKLNSVEGVELPNELMKE